MTALPKSIAASPTAIAIITIDGGDGCLETGSVHAGVPVVGDTRPESGPAAIAQTAIPVTPDSAASAAAVAARARGPKKTRDASGDAAIEGRPRRKLEVLFCLAALACVVAWIAVGGSCFDGTTAAVASSGEETVDLIAPPGSLGVKAERTCAGPSCASPTVITLVQIESPLRDAIRIGDRLLAVDGEDVRLKAHRDVYELIQRKWHATKKLTVARPVLGARWPVDAGSAAADDAGPHGEKAGSLGSILSPYPGMYSDPQRVMEDAGALLSSHVGSRLHPILEHNTLYDDERDGVLSLRGTIPMTFRGVAYDLPIRMIVPPAYPRQPPRFFLRPSTGVAVRCLEHTSPADGRVLLPYLRHDRGWRPESQRPETHNLKEAAVRVGRHVR